MFVRDRRGLGRSRGWVRHLLRLVPAVMLSFTPKSVPTTPVPMEDGVPTVTSSIPPDCPTPSSSLTSSGQSATPSSQTLAWGCG